MKLYWVGGEVSVVVKGTTDQTLFGIWIFLYQ